MKKILEGICHSKWVAAVALLLLAQTASGGGDSGGGSGGGEPFTAEDYEEGYQYQKTMCPEHDVPYVNGKCPVSGCDCEPTNQADYYGDFAWGREFFKNLENE